MIDAIKEELRKVDERVLFGEALADDNNTWDCLLVRRERIRKGTSKFDSVQYVSVRIIREDAIPDGIEQKVIDRMRNVGWKRSDSDITYEYALNANEVVVEICKIEFCRNIKGCESI